MFGEANDKAGVFFFKAEDGIRDFHVTGSDVCSSDLGRGLAELGARRADQVRHPLESDVAARETVRERGPAEIGRASCRESVEVSPPLPALVETSASRSGPYCRAATMRGQTLAAYGAP